MIVKLAGALWVPSLLVANTLRLEVPNASGIGVKVSIPAAEIAGLIWNNGALSNVTVNTTGPPVMFVAQVWLYAAEYIRAQSMNHQFRALLQSYGYYGPLHLRRLERMLLTPRIGWTTVYVLAVASILLSGINFMIVWSLVKLP